MRKKIRYVIDKVLLRRALDELNYKILYYSDFELEARSGQCHFYFVFKKHRTIVKSHIDWGVPHQRPVYKSPMLKKKLDEIMKLCRKIEYESREEVRKEKLQL